MSFLFGGKKKEKVPIGKPPLPPSAAQPAKVKTAEEAKREANQQKEKEQAVERAKVVEETDDEANQRKKASRRISQTQFGKPLSYNAYITQSKAEQKN